MGVRIRTAALSGAVLLAAGGLLSGVASADHGPAHEAPVPPPLDCGFVVPQPAATLVGGNGDDVLVGGATADVIYGLGGRRCHLRVGRQRHHHRWRRRRRALRWRRRRPDRR